MDNLRKAYHAPIGAIYIGPDTPLAMIDIHAAGTWRKLLESMMTREQVALTGYYDD